MSKIWRVCEYCSQAFMAEIFRVNAGYARYCSKECYHKSTRQSIDCTCEYCGMQFTIRPSEAKKGGGRFCSDACYRTFVREQTHIKRTCQQCGKRFVLTRAELAKTPGLYCSRECKDAAQCKPHILKQCEYCGAEFTIYPYVEADPDRGKFCSKECHYQWRSENLRGENSPNWNGGSSFEPYGPEWNDGLRSTIRGRDDCTCAICRLFGNVVHHIDYCKTNNGPDNLITVCRNCHSTTNFNRDYWQIALADLMRRRAYAL